MKANFSPKLINDPLGDPGMMVEFLYERRALQFDLGDLSAISNWQTKNENSNVEDAGLFISEIKVDSGSMLKRLRTAPQGRAHRIRKRSNHVTMVLGSKNNDVQTN